MAFSTNVIHQQMNYKEEKKNILKQELNIFKITGFSLSPCLNICFKSIAIVMKHKEVICSSMVMQPLLIDIENPSGLGIRKIR